MLSVENIFHTIILLKQHILQFFKIDLLLKARFHELLFMDYIF